MEIEERRLLKNFRMLFGTYLINIFFLIVTVNGRPQTIDDGKYFIENGKMLITVTNGEKVFLSKHF